MSASIEENNNFDTDYEGMPLEDVVRAMKAIKTIKEEADEGLKLINKRYDYLRLTLIPRLLEDRGMSNITMPGVGRVTLTADIYASIPAEARDMAYQWMEDIGSGSLVARSINPSTLKAFLKERISKGDEIPQDLFKVTPFTRASITKA